MAIGRISGSMLKSNLTRNGVDLAFETNILYLDVTNARVGIGTSTPSTALHVIGTTTTNNLVVNNITSDDSTAIQINDAVNVSGLLTANAGLTINNNSNTWLFGSDGSTTLPAGGTITEGVVTSNPTIQLTPATPTVASQKLVIKGGGSYSFTTNGININYYVNTGTSGDTLTFYVYSDTYANQTLYWWIYPVGVGMTTPDSGTVVLSGSGGQFSIGIDSDAYEFTVRVSPEANNYISGSIGVESGLINADAPTFTSEHHLHLTTGNLTETSIFLGTDDHNVRTTTSGNIQITTPNTTNKVWEFGTNGSLTFPDSTIQNTAARITVVGDDSTGVILNAGETIKIAGAGGITTAVSGDVLTITGANQAQGITVVGDDSTGTRISDGETVKIAGTSNITTAVSGDTLTITGSKDIDINSISSTDSTAIQINDAVNVSGVITGGSNVVASQNLISNNSSGDEGGEILLAKPQTNSTIAGTGVTIDIWQNRLRFFEQGGSARGYFIDITNGGAGVSTLLSGGGGGSGTVTSITAGTGLTGGTITTTGTIALDFSTVVARIVGDDSTGTDLQVGETIKIAGTSNITTAVSGDTLTITGPDLSSYLTNSTLTVVGDDSTGVTLNSGETIKIAGAGGITTAVSGDTLTITGANQAQGITFFDDASTSTAIPDGGALQITSGEGISTSILGNVLTITNTSTQLEIDGGSAYSIYNAISEALIDGGSA
jgi:hypothetical protein